MTRPLGKTVNLSEAALLGIPKLTLPESTRFDQRDSIETTSLFFSLFDPFLFTMILSTQSGGLPRTHTLQRSAG